MVNKGDNTTPTFIPRPFFTVARSPFACMFRLQIAVKWIYKLVFATATHRLWEPRNVQTLPRFRMGNFSHTKESQWRLSQAIGRCLWSVLSSFSFPSFPPFYTLFFFFLHSCVFSTFFPIPITPSFLFCATRYSSETLMSQIHVFRSKQRNTFSLNWISFSWPLWIS